MKKTFLALAAIAIVSCSQVEEKINETIETTTNSVKEKAQAQVEETVGNTLNESLNKFVKSEDVTFQQVFPTSDAKLITEYKGKKIALPDGSNVILMKYKSNELDLIPMLEKEPSIDETKSDKVATKIDGETFLNKFSILEKFIPEGTFETGFLDELKNDKNLKFYRLSRFPNKSTIIINPKTQKVYQFVEIKK